MTKQEHRLAQLLAALRHARSLLILTHDNPDPDSLASGWVLRTILRRSLGIRVDLAYGGVIGRAENRMMVRLLRIPAQHITSIALHGYDAVALVDTQPATGNNSLPPDFVPDIVIDHHPIHRGTRGVAFHDVTSNVGACASLLYGYLHAAGLSSDRRLATALFYAIRSETQNLGREGSATDREAFLALFPHVDNALLARVEQAPFSRGYFTLLDQAFRSTRIYGKLAVTEMGEIPYPDVPAEIADLILRIDEVYWAFVMGRYRNHLHFSIRSEYRRAHAGRLLRRVVGPIGRAGGHGMMAGGYIDLEHLDCAPAVMEHRITSRLRKALGVAGRRGTPLLPETQAARRRN